MKNKLQKLSRWVVVSGLVAGMQFSVAYAQLPRMCAGILDPSDYLAKDVDIRDYELEAATDVHTLSEFLVKGDENLFIQHPGNIMNANQFAWALIKRAGSTETHHPLAQNGKIKYFELFSGGTEWTRGKRIFGQLPAIETFVNGIRQNANQEFGSSASQATVLFEGPAGTGKSLGVSLIMEAMATATMKHEDFYRYTFVWKNLDVVPSIAEIVTTVEGKYADPINDSPFTILPTSYQEAMLTLADKAVKEMTDGIAPKPKRKANPQASEIREKLIVYYTEQRAKTRMEEALAAKQAKDGPEAFLTEAEERAIWKDARLNDAEIVSVLNNHVEIRRVLAATGRSNTVVDKQPPNQEKWNQILGSENGLVINTIGQKTAFAFNPDGTIPQANGFVIAFDEFARNGKNFRDRMLGFFEEGVVRLGQNLWEIDAVKLTVSNTESIEENMNDGGSKAQLDRLNRQMFGYDVLPHRIAMTALGMQPKSMVYMRRLGKDAEGNYDTNLLPANLDALYPTPGVGEEFEGPDGGNYVVVFKDADSKVEFSPHTLQLVARVAAASRMVTDPKQVNEALKRDGQPAGDSLTVLNSPVFTNVIERLRVYEGSRDIKPTARVELVRAIKLAGEGSSGLSQRHVANILIRALVNEAQRPGQNNTVTLSLVKEVFNDLLDSRSIAFESHSEANLWRRHLGMILKELTMKDVADDLRNAASGGEANLEVQYNEFIHMAIALKTDENAKSYHSPKHGSNKPIDRSRITEINRRYFAKFGEPIPLDAIGQVFMVATQSGKRARAHGQLMEIIRDFYAERELDLLELDYENPDSEDADTRRKMGNFMESLGRDYGYSRQAALDAISLRRNIEDPKRAP